MPDFCHCVCSKAVLVGFLGSFEEEEIVICYIDSNNYFEKHCLAGESQGGRGYESTLSIIGASSPDSAWICMPIL